MEMMRAVGGPLRPHQSGAVGASRGRHESRRMSMSRSSPPSVVRISRMRGDVCVRYVREVRLLRMARGELVSSAAT